MSAKFLTSMWDILAPPAGSHLWQSTLCLIIAGLLTLILRRNSARTRHALWLAASLKFLVPFSLLIALGSRMAIPRMVQHSETRVFIMKEQFNKSLEPPAVLPSVDRSATLQALLHALPAVLVVVWFAGFAVVLVTWYARWRRISAAMRRSVPLLEGREVESLRRVERVGGLRRHIGVLLSYGSVEPGIFGIIRPVLIWPKGISEHLEDSHLEAILAHEVWHVRRRDNLAATIHMLVEAVFWFHPLVWWLGARLVEERERACDEEVLEAGSAPKDYAEGILKTCQFCVGSPLACVSGVTGGELKRRIVRIMTERRALRLDMGRKLLLAIIGSVAVAGPVTYGLITGTPAGRQAIQTSDESTMSFEVASVKPDHETDNRRGIMMPPGRFVARGVTVKFLIENAYDVRGFQVSGGPDWIDTEKFDIDAKLDDSTNRELQDLSKEQRWKQVSLRLQALLADRFKLNLSHSTKDLPVYHLVIAKNGPKLQEVTPDVFSANASGGANVRKHSSMMEMGIGRMSGQAIPLELLVRQLSRQLGRNVVDNTGLKGLYNFSLQWTPDQMPTDMFKGPDGGNPGADNAPALDSTGPSIFTALQEQLGLRLESTKGPVNILIIDHIDRPSAD